jgi:hypothetical protein
VTATNACRTPGSDQLACSFAPLSVSGPRVQQRPAEQQRDQASEADQDRRHRALEQHELRVAGDETEGGLRDDAEEDQNADGIHPAVPDDPDGDARSRQDAGQDERRDCALPGRAQ